MNSANELVARVGRVPNRGSPIHMEVFVPAGEVEDDLPEISIVVPALNEEITIGEFVDWCHEGLRRANVRGEIIIVDSSSDATPAIALAKGARVLRTPKRGLGQAYIDVIPFVRGKFIIMGDCDLTYDFRELGAFVASFRAGNEFVMGSRFKGHIEHGAMPPLHRYFGTPLTTWILNRIYRSRFSDIHCGMRGLTRDALQRLDLTSAGWEYASEMVLKASRAGLRIDEVPVTFYKDREGRLSHHRRAGFWSPWLAGWINLKVMLAYSPDSFLIKPGLVFMSTGLLLCSALAFGSFSLGPIVFDLYWMLLGLTSTVLGFALFQAGIFARIFHGLRSGIERTVLRYISYDRGMAVAAVMLGIGLLIDGNFLYTYLTSGFRVDTFSHAAIYGLLLLVLGVQTLAFTLLLELGRRINRSSR
jgi:hypothetical protein